MEKVSAVLVTVTITLLVSEGILLVVRSPRCARRQEPLCLAAFLFGVALGLAMPAWLGAGSALAVFILWAAGAFLIEVQSRSRRIWWAASCAAFICLLFLLKGLGYGDTFAFSLFDALATCVLAVFPVLLMIGIGRGSRSTPLFVALASACVWIASASAQTVFTALGFGYPDVSGLALFVMAFAMGWLVFQEGYPSRAGWRGKLAALELQERLPHAAYASVVESETALARQDRLVAAGLLVLGAAHEFKNTLSYIRAVAEHGLQEGAADRKNESLRLLLEHVDAGRESAVTLLENLSRDGREKLQVVDTQRDLEPFIRLIRAAYRAEGILMRSAFGSDVRFPARRSELEQILHNLVRNAVEGLRSRGVGEEKTIELSSRAPGSRPSSR